jgi:hypothetical protein
MPDGSTYPKNTAEFQVDLDKLLRELGQIDGKKDEVSSATGDLRSTIKNILDNSGYHKAALAMIRQIHDMPATKKADCLRTFRPMFEVLLPVWEQEVQDMLDKADKEASEMESDLGK